MIRTIYPIGQGAFYSEKFENFTIVYDCGEWKKTHRAEMLVVEKSIGLDSKIDVLFISHFDFDHISLIPTLKQKCKIKFCILPVINEIEKIIISNIYMAKGEKDLATLVKNPRQFFDLDTKIIYVDLEDNNQIKEEGFIIQRIEDLMDEEHISSGTELSFSEINWVFVPYNIEHTERRNELIKVLKKLNLQFTNFTIEYNDYIEEHKKEIRKAYGLLRGGVNSNSMYLYSGSAKQENSGFINSLEFYYKKYLSIEYRTACVYTGDGKLDCIKKIYKKYWSNVGTIQLPHHGSEKNFNFNFLNYTKEKYLFFASFGNNNSYGHPSKNVIINLHDNESVFFPVSETVATEFVEEIQGVR